MANPLRPLPLAAVRFVFAVPAVVCFVVTSFTDSAVALVVGIVCALAWSWQTDARRPDSVRTPRGLR